MNGPEVVIIGAGIAGLAAAERLQARRGPGRVVVLDRLSRAGGKISTLRVDGLVLEEGPDSFLSTKPAGMALARTLGLESRLIGTRPFRQRSFVKRSGALHPLPEGFSGLVPSRLGPLLRSPLLSVGGRLRAGCEAFIPRRRAEGDESVGAFVRRRFGREAYERMIEPLLSGIYAGDGDRLSLAATFPQLRDAEARRGRVLGAMLARRTPAATGRSPFVTFPEGLSELVTALVARLPDVELRTGTGVRAIRRRGAGYAVECEGGETIVGRSVLVATPAGPAAELLEPLDAPLASCVREIPHIDTATVYLAYRGADLERIPLGYGYVSPRIEGGSIVACTCTSNKFPHRAPQDLVLLRAFVGRDGDEVLARGDATALVATVREEFRRVLGIHAAPVHVRVTRWPRGLPQYTLGHLDRVARINSALARWPGLEVAGASYHGVGIPDCIASGWQAAAAIARSLEVG